MRSRLAERVRRLPDTGMDRFFQLATERRDLVSLGVGEPDFVTPRVIVEAGIASLERGETGYTATPGTIELRTAVARHLERRYGASYDPASEIVITVGVSEAICVTLQTLLDPGDEVILHQPGFYTFIPAVILAGGRPVILPTRAEDGFQVVPEDLAAAITPRTRAVLLNYPTNPTGAVLEHQRAAALAEVLGRHDLTLISDEIYDRLVYGTEHVCLAALDGLRERTVLLGGFSKDYAMTGWRLGYAAAPAELMAGIRQVHQYTVGCPPITAQKAALAALEEGEDAVQAMGREYARRRRLLVDGLRRLGLPCVEPGGAFYAFPSIADTGLSDTEFADRLLEQEKVFVLPGSTFGEAGAGFIRCSYASSSDVLQEALERMGRFVSSLDRHQAAVHA